MTATSEIVSADTLMNRPITYLPFMAKKEITLTINMVLKFISKPTKSGARPSVEDAMKFAMLCQARGLDPWEGDAFLIGYDSKDGPQFNLVTAHQALLKRAEVHPEFDGMESGVVVQNKEGMISDLHGDFYSDDDKLMGGWARIHLKKKKIPVYRRIKLGSFAKPFGVWQTNPGGMIVKCAEADALRSAFPNSLGGMYLREELDTNGTAREPFAPVEMPRAIGEMPHPTDDTKTIDPGDAQDYPQDEPSPKSTEAPEATEGQQGAEMSPDEKDYAKFLEGVESLARGSGSDDAKLASAIHAWQTTCRKGTNKLPTKSAREGLMRDLSDRRGVWSYLAAPAV